MSVLNPLRKSNRNSGYDTCIRKHTFSHALRSSSVYSVQGPAGEVRRYGKPAHRIKRGLTEPYICHTPVKKWSIFYMNPLSTDTTATVFERLTRQWKHDTLLHSSLTEICFHPAYQTIMAMGRRVLPFILKDLETQFGHWFYALRHIAQSDVAFGTNNPEEARQRWLQWGRRELLL